MLEKIAAHSISILNVRDIAIFLRDPDSDIFKVAVALGNNVDELKTVVVNLRQGLIGNILASGLAEYVNDPSSDPRVIHIPGTPEEEFKKFDAVFMGTVTSISERPAPDHLSEIDKAFYPKVKIGINVGQSWKGVTTDFIYVYTGYGMGDFGPLTF